MVNVHIDPAFDDAERRRRLYGGDVLVYTHVPEVAAFAAYTREMITELFAPHDPLTISSVHSPEELADLLIEFKPRWIHDPRSMEHVRAIARALGCEPEKIHADVPKLRTAFPQGGLSTGIAYAFQAHRDTWYAAPKAQLNWWMPVWPPAPAATATSPSGASSSPSFLLYATTHSSGYFVLQSMAVILLFAKVLSPLPNLRTNRSWLPPEVVSKESSAAMR